MGNLNRNGIKNDEAKFPPENSHINNGTASEVANGSNSSSDSNHVQTLKKVNIIETVAYGFAKYFEILGQLEAE